MPIVTAVQPASDFYVAEDYHQEYFRNNPTAQASLRAPIYEEKVVDFILELADVSEKKVSIAELTQDDEEEKTAES